MTRSLQWIAAALLACAVLHASSLPAQEPKDPVTAQARTSIDKSIGLGMAAAVAISVSVLGAGYAVARIGSAALGAAVEKPELLTRSLLFIALAEGLAVLGFAIAMMLLQKI